MGDLPALIQRRAIMLGLALAMIAIALIGAGGMTASVMMAESIQGSGSAINVAGSLRKQSHRMGSQVLATALNGETGREPLRQYMTQFERSLEHSALLAMVARQPDSDYSRTYRAVRMRWAQELRPALLAEAMPGVDRHGAEQHDQLLIRIDAFVAEIHAMVAQLEHDTEEKIKLLRRILAGGLALTFVVLVAALAFLHRGVLAPLENLLDGAARMAWGDFSARAAHVREDELGRVGQAFNFMAAELGKLYQGLEQRVAEKTAELSRSNQSLELLYHTIARLNKDPLAPATHRALLDEVERVLGLEGSMVCLTSGSGESATVLAASRPSGPGVGLGESQDCRHCAELRAPASHRLTDGREAWMLPLRDNERHYGVLQAVLPPGRELETWQSQLLEALAQHVGVALGMAHQSAQERRLALLEERSVIARELHDSLAQSLAYLKIQVSLLQPLLQDPARAAEAEAVLRDLREGINAAYRQLRELLVTFRLKVEGDFRTLLEHTIAEFAQRGGIEIGLSLELGDCRLGPNQEVHALHILREALSNVLRHARARHAWVALRHDPGTGRVSLRVEDDGVGLPQGGITGDHFGLAIMRERAKCLAGDIDIANRPEGGTAVGLVFSSTGGTPVRGKPA